MRLARRLACVVSSFLLAAGAASRSSAGESQQRDGHFGVPKADVGTVVPLTGKWMFRPGAPAEE